MEMEDTVYCHCINDFHIAYNDTLAYYCSCRNFRENLLGSIPISHSASTVLKISNLKPKHLAEIKK